MAFAGEVAELPLGVDGLTGQKNISEIGPGHLLVAENLTYQAGTLQKEGGSAKFNSSAIAGTPIVLGGHDWHPTGTVTQRLIVLLGDGTLRKDTGATDFSVTLKSGLTISDVNPVFVEGGIEAAGSDKKLFVFTGVNVVQVLAADGATTGDIATPAADWSGANQPTFGVIHENRMFAGGNANDPHRVYYTPASDHEDFTGAGSGSLSIYPGEGERITGGISFKGLLILFKFPKGIYLVDTSSVTLSEWSVDKHSTDIGGISPNGHTAIDNDVIFIDAGATLHLISAITAFGNIGTRSLSSIANLTELLLDETNIAQLPNCQAIYYTAKAEAHITMSSSGSNFDRRLVIDFNRPDFPRFRLSTKDINRSMWLNQDANRISRPYIGDSSGTIWKLDQDTRNKDGGGYSGKFQTAHLDFSHLDPALGVKNKNGKFLELVIEPKGNHDLTVDVVWDTITIQTITFNMGESGAALGSFVLDTSKLAGTGLTNKRKRMEGSGKRLSLIGRNSAANENFSVSRFYVGFTRGTDRGL